MTDEPLVDPNPSTRIAALEQELRVSAAASGYARCYAAMAVFSVFMNLLPLHRRLDPDRSPWPNLWGLNTNNETVQLGIGLIVAEMVLLTVAAFGAPRGRTVPILIAVLAVPEVLILVTNVDMPAGTEFTAAGIAAVVVALAGIVIAAAAAVHLPHLVDTGEAAPFRLSAVQPADRPPRVGSPDRPLVDDPAHLSHRPFHRLGIDDVHRDGHADDVLDQRPQPLAGSGCLLRGGGPPTLDPDGQVVQRTGPAQDALEMRR